MKQKAKKLLKFLRSTKMLALYSVTGFIAVLLFIYALVPLPNIADGYLPDDVRMVSNNAPLSLNFSQPMKIDTVESNFSIEPSMKGVFEWTDSKTLTFTPDTDFKIDDEYKVIIGAGAMSQYMKRFGVDLTIHFRVSGSPLIRFISPYLEEAAVESEVELIPAEDLSGFVEDVKLPEQVLVIPTDQRVTVMFDRPMRALTTLEESKQDFPELKIDPPVKGKYKWVGTTAFQYIPDEWTPSTTYTLTLPAGIASLDGGKTEEDKVWSLSTEAPSVVSSFPYEASDTFKVDEAIRLTFNQPMELDFIRPGENVLLYPTNDVDADVNPRNDGFFNTEVVYGKDENGKVDRTILVFKPEFDYQYSTYYKLVLNEGLSGAAKKAGNGYGDRNSSAEFSLNFKTVSEPDIIKFFPAQGEKQYDDTSVRIWFASAITPELIEDNISIDVKFDEKPTVTVDEFYTNDYGTVWEATIDYDLEPSRYYNFTFKGPFKDSAGNKSDKGFKTSFKTAAKAPYLSLLTPQRFGLFMEGVDPTYTMKYVNVDQLNLEFCKMSQADFFNTSSQYSWYSYKCRSPQKKTINLNSKLNATEWIDLNVNELFGSESEQGMYFVEMSSPQYLNYKSEPYRFFQTFFVSDTNLALKKSDRDLLVWATDLKTGLPVSRMELKVYSSAGVELKTGVTNGEGVYKITQDFDDGVYVVGRKTLEGESRWGIASQYWSDGIQTWQYSLTGDYVGYNEPRVYLFTERPLYRPGDTIYYKGIYRMDKDADLKFPKDKKVRVVLEDSEYNEVDSELVGMLADGSFNGKFSLDDKARLGRYNVYVETVDLEYSQRFYHNFFVEEFKKPKFKVELLGSDSEVRLGDAIEADVMANYYFGGAIQQGEVSWTLMREPYFFNEYRGDGYFSFGQFRGFHCFWGYCGSEAEIVAEGEGQLDQAGRLKLKLDTDLEDAESQSYLYTLSATVENQDGETVSQRQTFIVHEGSYYIGLSPENYIVSSGKPLELNMVTVAPDATPVEGKKVALELYKEKWNTVKKQGVDGAFYDESVRELEFIKKRTVTSEDGSAVYEMSLGGFEAGMYVVKAKGSDGKRSVNSETNFYISSSDFVNWGSSNNNRMELVPDNLEYFVGGKARILVKSPYGSEDEPAKALVTYERGGIMNYEVVDIDSNTDTIEVMITEEMVPNVYIAVMVVKGAGENFDVLLDAQDKERLLVKKRTLEKEIEDLKAEITTLSDAEEDVSTRTEILIAKKKRELDEKETELDSVKGAVETIEKQSGATIDFNLIKPDFKFGITNLLVNKREHQIFVDLETSQDSYEVGEEIEIEIHTKDYQNRPVPAVVSLAVVDESLLALKANRKVSPLDYFYGQRALQVDTAASLTIHMDRVNVNAAKGAKGGDGGGDEELFGKKRGEFKDTAYFNPFIETDQGGYAKITFDPPDNLTTWEMWAVATSEEDQFGMVKEDFVVKKPVSISSILPRFVISGDELTIGALVHNQSGDDLETKIELSAPGLAIKAVEKQSIFVKDGQSARANWLVTVDAVTFDGSITVEFKSNEDTVQYQLPVKTFAFPEVVSTNGTVETTVTEKIRVPKDVAQGMGHLSVRTGGSVLTKFIKQFEALADYPYGCAEQIASQILPTLVVQAQAARKTSIDLYSLLNIDANKTREIIGKTLQKFTTFQRFDGGYGFWEGSDYSYPMLTAYVLYAQKLAEESGYTVSDNSFDLAQQYLWKRLNAFDPNLKLTFNDRAFVLWVLSEVGQNDTGITLSLYEDRDSLSVYARALLLMNLRNLFDSGQKSVRPFMDKLKSEIVTLQKSDDRTAHFEEKTHYFWDLNTDLRTTAMVLMALNRDNSKNPILPKMVNYLVSAKQKGQLLNTQETAWLLMAMLEYADAHDVLDPDFKLSTKLNRDKLFDENIDSTNLMEIFEALIPIDELQTDEQVNEVVFRKDGTGEMLYDLEFKYYLPNEKVWPVERGFHVVRDYYTFDTDETKSVDTMTSGEVYRGELTVIVPDDMHYVVVEERLPAGLVAINFNLDTSDTSLKHKLDEEIRPAGETYWYQNPLWYFNHTEMRDDRVLLFADSLPKGVYTYNFLVRAGLPGKYHHLPASAHQMYFPEVFGRTGGAMLEIKE